jgi:hypothetical protein
MPTARRSPRFAPIPFLVLLLLAACSAHRGDGADRSDDSVDLPECTSYVRELRACSASVGAPATAANTLAGTLAQSSAAERARLEGACAENRERLRASCK